MGDSPAEQGVADFSGDDKAATDAAGTDHIRCTIASADGSRMKAIAFRAMGTDLGELLLSERQFPLHIAGRLVADEWGAKRVPSLQIEDAAPVK